MAEIVKRDMYKTKETLKRDLLTGILRYISKRAHMLKIVSESLLYGRGVMV